jgi:pyruvate/2-oxoglutarate/acetoin dehydrogenase E1 component
MPSSGLHPVLSVVQKMTYKESLTAAMSALAADPLTRFVGYGMAKGGALGTLRHVPREQIVETPVAENLLLGVATGLSLAGLRPVAYIERMDFLLNALDCLVNHLDKAANLSRGEFTPAVIVRITVGNHTKPLFTGPPHVQDFSLALRWMLKETPVIQLEAADDIAGIYAAAREQQLRGESTVLVEYKDLI